jgi:DNA-binding protein H-NS
MSLEELVELDTRVQQAVVNAKQRVRDEVKEKINELLASAGLSADELFGGKVAPKYRNPDNARETWTGRGRRPRWLLARLSKGGEIDGCRVQRKISLPVITR